MACAQPITQIYGRVRRRGWYKCAHLVDYAQIQHGSAPKRLSRYPDLGLCVAHSSAERANKRDLDEGMGRQIHARVSAYRTAMMVSS